MNGHALCCRDEAAVEKRRRTLGSGRYQASCRGPAGASFLASAVVCRRTVVSRNLATASAGPPRDVVPGADPIRRSLDARIEQLERELVGLRPARDVLSAGEPGTATAYATSPMTSSPVLTQALCPIATGPEPIEPRDAKSDSCLTRIG